MKLRRYCIGVPRSYPRIEHVRNTWCFGAATPWRRPVGSRLRISMIKPVYKMIYNVTNPKRTNDVRDDITKGGVVVTGGIVS